MAAGASDTGQPPPASWRQSMAWLHTWAGLLPGWLLFVIFLFGTVSFFQSEINAWMRPELARGAVTRAALDQVSAFLAATAPQAESWTVSLPSLRGGEPITASWSYPEGNPATAGETTLAPATGRKIAVRDTQGGWFLYRFHFDLHYMPWWLARYLVSIAALGMLVAILSGIVIHKKIFADFFLLRFGKGQRSWLDAHNVSAVLALPFHLMITYTGLVALLFHLMPWAVVANFPDEQAFYAAAAQSPERTASGAAAPMLSMSALADKATRLSGGQSPGTIIVHHPGDANAMAEIWPQRTALSGPSGATYLSAVTGAAIQRPGANGAATATQDVMIELHTGLFAHGLLRWLYVLSGVGGTIMVASGLVLWTVKRRGRLPDPAHPHFGFRLVERLNIGVLTGAPAGIAVYFLANRLLPLGMAERATWEINSLFIGWGAFLVWACARPVRRAWIETLTACAALYALTPLANALTTARGLVPSLIAGDWAFAGFDLAMLGMAAACALAAWKAACHKPKSTQRRAARTLAGAGA